ncbi:hypothetical protein NXF25_012690 [Crotalus adamanteus]|uniref:Uncharacterized protein n=1 Tax=Crotalus adamanteus TaxID=8729 RepID=A0AAW1BD85_CROAD
MSDRSQSRLSSIRSPIA